MARTTLSVVASVMLLSPTATPVHVRAPTPPAVSAAAASPDRAAVEERFALRFCFNQYKSQRDATACLARHLR